MVPGAPFLLAGHQNALGTCMYHLPYSSSLIDGDPGDSWPINSADTWPNGVSECPQGTSTGGDGRRGRPDAMERYCTPLSRYGQGKAAGHLSVTDPRYGVPVPCRALPYRGYLARPQRARWVPDTKYHIHTIQTQYTSICGKGVLYAPKSKDALSSDITSRGGCRRPGTPMRSSRPDGRTVYQ